MIHEEIQQVPSLEKRYKKMTLFLANAFNISTMEYNEISYIQVPHLKKGKKEKQKLFSACSPKKVFLKHYIILYEKARACPCPFVGAQLIDSDLQKYFNRAIVGTKAMSSAVLIKQLKTFRKFFQSTENKRIKQNNKIRKRFAQ